MYSNRRFIGRYVDLLLRLSGCFKELAKNLDKEEVFSKAKYIKQWYAELYQTCPNYSETGLDVQGSNGTVNAQAIYSGKLFVLILMY